MREVEHGAPHLWEGLRNGHSRSPCGSTNVDERSKPLEDWCKLLNNSAHDKPCVTGHGLIPLVVELGVIGSVPPKASPMSGFKWGGLIAFKPGAEEVPWRHKDRIRHQRQKWRHTGALR